MFDNLGKNLLFLGLFLFVFIPAILPFLPFILVAMAFFAVIICSAFIAGFLYKKKE